MADTLSDQKSNIPFHLPQGMAYTCHNSGVCCNVFDSIPVDEAAQDAISGMDQGRLNHVAGNDADQIVTVETPESQSPVLARKACGSCIMLTEDHLCAIHKIMGEEAKPQACQDFPWRYVETPGGIYVGLSFVCPSVRDNRGQLVTAQEESVRLKYSRAASVRKAPDEIMLNSHRALSWEDYLAFEQGLLDLMSLEDEPLSVRLIACCMLPGFIDQTLAMAGAEDMGRADVIDIISALRTRGYDHLLKLGRKNARRRQSPRPRRMFLGMLASFANTLQRRENQGRFLTVTGVIAQYARSAIGLGAIRLAPVDRPVSAHTLDEARLPDSGPVAELISRYITHSIERKDLVLYGDVNRRLRMMAVSAALIAWYAAALDERGGAAAGADRTSDHWEEAVSIVERLYGFHSTFFRFFERNKAFADIVDSFLLKPAFPYVLFR